MNAGNVIQPEIFESTTVYFSHLDGFEEIIKNVRDPVFLTEFLNSFYALCDTELEKHSVYKVETINDGYMVGKHTF